MQDWKIEQYGRLLDQLEREKKELYFLYNVFFVASSALISFNVANKLLIPSWLYDVIGVCLSYTWLSTHNKQRKYRDEIIQKIVEVEKDLDLKNPYNFLKESTKSSLHGWNDALMFWKVGGIAKILTLLPFIIFLIWIFKLSQDLSHFLPQQIFGGNILNMDFGFLANLDWTSLSEVFNNFALGVAAIVGIFAGKIIFDENRKEQSRRKKLRKQLIKKYPRSQLNKTFKIVDTPQSRGRLYLIDLKENTRRWIQSGETYKNLNFNWSDYITITNEDFSRYLEEAPILTDGKPGE